VPVKQVLRDTDFFTLSDHASTEVGVPKLAQKLPQMQMKSVHSCRLTQTEFVTNRVCVSWMLFEKIKIVGERKIGNRDFKYVIVIAGCSALSHASYGCAGRQTRLISSHIQRSLLATLIQKKIHF